MLSVVEMAIVSLSVLGFVALLGSLVVTARPTLNPAVREQYLRVMAAALEPRQETELASEVAERVTAVALLHACPPRTARAERSSLLAAAGAAAGSR